MAEGSFKNNVLATVFGLVFAILILEVAGRVLPIRMGFGEGMDYLRFDPVLGFEIDPGVESINYKSDCLNVEGVSINGQGMRALDDVVPADRPEGIRVAVLGDSFMMAREVGDDEFFAANLQRQLPGSEFLNFGVPGYGTLQYQLSWQEKAAEYAPDLTVLSFLELNDVEDNSYDIAAVTGWQGLRPSYNDQGDLVLPDENAWKLQQNKSFSGLLHRNLRHYSYTYYLLDELLLKRLLNRLRGSKVRQDDYLQQYWWASDPLLLHAGVYQTEPDEIWAKAWSDTERSIIELNRQVRAGGGQLVILYMPNTGNKYRALLPGLYKDKVGTDMPDTMDVGYPRRRLSQLAAAESIAFVDPSSNFERYTEKHELGGPKFSFVCDGHFSPVGHYVVSNTFAKWLLDSGWVSTDDLANPEVYTDDKFLDVSPSELLGDEAYSEVFNWRGVYTGNSDAGEF